MRQRLVRTCTGSRALLTLYACRRAGCGECPCLEPVLMIARKEEKKKKKEKGEKGKRRERKRIVFFSLRKKKEAPVFKV